MLAIEGDDLVISQPCKIVDAKSNRKWEIEKAHVGLSRRSVVATISYGKIEADEGPRKASADQ